MVASSISLSAPKKTVALRHALLEELIGIALKHAGDQYLGLASTLAGALIDATDGDTRLIQQRLRAGNLLRNRNFAFLHLATTTLEQALRREVAELAPIAKLARSADQPLSLVPFEEMDSKVALGGVSKPFEALYADALQKLNVRLAFLLDRDILRTSQNPFRPEVFLMALQQAWTEFDPEEASAGLLQPWIKPGLFIELGPMLEALSLALQSKGVLPGSVDGYQRRKPDGGAAKAKANQAALAQQLRQFFAASDVAGSAAGEIVDGIASGMLQGTAGSADLTIPELPASALATGGNWAPNAAMQPMQRVASGSASTSGSGSGSALAAALTSPSPSPSAGVSPSVWAPVSASAPGSAPVSAPGSPPAPAAAPGLGRADGAAVGGAAVVRGAATVDRNPQQPLLAYLAELQKAVPYESIGSLAAARGVAASPHAQAHDADADAHSQAHAHTHAHAPAPAIGGQAATAGNVFYLPALKQSMPKGSLTRADESTIDLLSAVFDTVFRDQSISPEIRELIRFLQIPVLKAALVDKNFFFQEAHPARRLLELLSRMGWEQRKGPDDPLFQAMQRSVDRVGRDYEQELSVFTEAVNELEASIQAEEKAASAAIAAPIAAALKQERAAESAKLAKNAVALRIGTGEVIAVIEAFLEQRWVSVLTIAYSIEDEKPGAVNNATKAMDELIWSVRPKLNATERKQLISRLPGLLSALNKWLDVIQWQDADRLQFFAELAECHASIVRAPVELSPARQLEISMQVAQQAAERRLLLQAKEQARAEAEAKAADKAGDKASTPEADEENAAIEVDALERGMWLEFEQADGGSRKVKLAWISPLRTLYIFSTAARQEAFSMQGEELAKRFRNGSVQVLRAEGLVTVALSRALSRGADNDASITSPAAVG